MSFALQHDMGAWLGHAPGFAQISATAGGSGDASEVTGFVFDRHATAMASQATGRKNRFNSVTAVMQVQATLASGETAAVLCNFQDSANNSDWADYGDALASTVVISAAGGAVTAKAATIKHTVDLAEARQYIRLQATVNLSRAGTDTGVFSGVLVFGGADTLPTDVISPLSP